MTDNKEMDFCGELCKYAEDIINRQKAEIEKLQAEVETELDKLNAEKNDVMYHKAQIKAKAYKECVETVKTIICDNTYPDFDKNGKAVCIWKPEAYKNIDDLLKELEGDHNAERE